MRYVRMFGRAWNNPSAAMAVAITSLVIALTSGAWALTISPSPGIKVIQLPPKPISVCVGHKKGTLYIAKKCAPKDKRIEWDAQGPPGATGAAGSSGPAGTAGPAGPTGPPGAGAATVWAYVTDRGAIGYGNGVTEVTNPTTGDYDVYFDREVGRCAYEVTFTDHTWGFAEAGINPFIGSGVVVTSRNTSNELAEQGFYLAVFC